MPNHPCCGAVVAPAYLESFWRGEIDSDGWKMGREILQNRGKIRLRAPGNRACTHAPVDSNITIQLGQALDHIFGPPPLVPEAKILGIKLNQMRARSDAAATE